MLDIKEKSLLELVVDNPEIAKIKNLKITGNFTSNDLHILKNQFDVIENLDISETEIINLGSFRDKSLESIAIPNSITSINDVHCKIITLSDNPHFKMIDDIIYDYNVENIIYCPNFKTKIVLPNSVVAIRDSAFYGCRYLISIKVPKSVVSIGKSAFAGCISLLSIEMPKGVTEIGENAFACCRSLKSFIIPHGVTVIERRVFAGCRSLTSIIIPNYVVEIGNQALYGCHNLTSVTIPKSVKKIGADAFSNCKRLLAVKCEALKPLLLSDNYYRDAQFSNSENMLLKIPAKSIDLYRKAKGWRDFGIIKEF